MGGHEFGEYRPFAEEVELSELFRDRVERLLLTNLDLVTTYSKDSLSYEILTLIDERPIPGDRLKYHYVYNRFDSSSPASNTYGILINDPVVVEGLSPFRKDNVRSYRYINEGFDIVIMNFSMPSFNYREALTYNHLIEYLDGSIAHWQTVEAKNKPSVQALKTDLETLQRSTPVKRWK